MLFKHVLGLILLCVCRLQELSYTNMTVAFTEMKGADPTPLHKIKSFSVVVGLTYHDEEKLSEDHHTGQTVVESGTQKVTISPCPGTGHGKHDATLECDFYTAECSSSALPPGDTASLLLIDEEVTATCNLSCSGVISIGKGALGCATERCRNEDRRCNVSPVLPIAVTKQDQAALKNELNLQIHDTLRLHHLHASSHKRDALFESLVNRTPWSRTSVRKGMAPKYSASAPVKAFQAPFVMKNATNMPPSSEDFSALVSESLCSDPLLNRVKWELYLPAHRHDLISRKLSEMTRCRTVALQGRHPAPVVETSTSSTTAERSPKDSTPTPAAPEASFSMVDALCGFVMKTWLNFIQLATGKESPPLFYICALILPQLGLTGSHIVGWAGAWTLITSCAVFHHISAASYYSTKEIRRRVLPRGRLGLTVLTVVVLFHLFNTVGAAKPRPFREATFNGWAEGKPGVQSVQGGHSMVAGPDGSLYVYGGYYPVGTIDNDLFKLDLDAKEWHIITPRGSVRPRGQIGHGMVAVGNHLYMFGGQLFDGSSHDEFFRFSTMTLRWEQLDAQKVSGSSPSSRSYVRMVAVGSDIYVLGGVVERVATDEFYRYSTTARHWERLDATQVSGSPPSPRYGHGMVALGVDLIVFGGFTNSGVY